jgi:hypothetical protein
MRLAMESRTNPQKLPGGSHLRAKGSRERLVVHLATPEFHPVGDRVLPSLLFLFSPEMCVNRATITVQSSFILRSEQFLCRLS